MQATEKPITKVLLIDDDPEEFYIFQTALQDINPAITISHLTVFGEDLIKREVHHYDLVFLDINMPVMDGFDWLLKIREAGNSVPVIMYSTTMNQNRINKSYQSGADLFLPKPDNFSELTESIEKILQFNWVNPGEIKEKFYHNGNYLPFIAERASSNC